MKTTRGERKADFLGVDLTDRYSQACRAIDVCGLSDGNENSLEATFWQWQWATSTEGELDISSILPEIRDAKATMLDGPQGLASIGKSLRDCERQSGAAGKTPCTLPDMNRPFAGYIRSSIELFFAFKKAQCSISPDKFHGGISEVYPGYIWGRLVGRVLPKKSSQKGRLARKLLLEALGVTGLPELPTHDQNDACIAAILAAAAAGKLSGVSVNALGSPLQVDVDGTLREGPMAILQISEDVQQKLMVAIKDIPDVLVKNTQAQPGEFAPEVIRKANSLMDCLIQCAQNGDAKVCTYAWAYRHLFDTSFKKWSQAYARQVISLAKSTDPRELLGLGAVQLDAFIVSNNSGLPSNGHWESAGYEREDWERVLGTGAKLH